MIPPHPAIVPLGENGWTVVLGRQVDRALNRRVLQLARRITAAALPGLVEVVPAYATLTVFFDGSAEVFLRHLAPLCADLPEFPAQDSQPTGTRHTIPVRYDGPDLAAVARSTGLSIAEVIRRHQEPEYLVYLLGFVPGFAYLGDLHPSLVLPRRSSPRTRVPPGAVAIAAAQTAVYPLATPGGWHLLGTTPLRMFDPARTPPALLRAGDRVRFESIA